jgi:hypothetical protein
MEVNITELFNNVDPSRYSASQAELGPDAGTLTWERAVDRVIHTRLLNHAEIDTWRVYVRSSGGWSAEEVAAMTDTELQALFLQWVSGDMREAGLSAIANDADWAQYEKDANDGTVSGSIFRTDDGQIFFDITP